MIESNRHIISTIEWQSSFDNKSGSSSLQDRLSYWSKYKLPRQADSVFNHISSPYITWQIDQLTIDLGTIYLDELEHDLSAKFKKELREKLADLLFSSKQSNKNIKVVHRNISINSLLEYYLLKGSMPWNFNRSYGSINEILEYQLEHNSREVIYLLRYLGKEVNVRKRIAWQLNEKNQKNLINKLEPYYHSFIGNTLDEMVELQYKFKIVPSHISTFKKYLNFWVLNYLFSRSNLVFSKEGFIADIIFQMGQWYNMDADSFFESVQVRSQEMKLKNILIFDAKESKRVAKKSSTIHQEKSGFPEVELERSWILLKDYLQNAALIKSKTSYQEYNELIHRLYFHNSQRFVKLLSNLDNSTSFWSRTIDGLSTQSFEVIIDALAPTKSKSIIGAINLLANIGGRSGGGPDSKEYWVATLTFLSGSKSKHITTEDFLDLIISQNNHIHGFEHALELFYSSDIESSDKSSGAIDLYDQIRKLARKKSLKNDKIFLENRAEDALIIDNTGANIEGAEIDVSRLLSILLDHISNRSIHQTSFKRAQKSFVRKVVMNPLIIYNTMVEFKENELLYALIPIIIDENLASRILQRCKPQFYDQLLLIIEILESEDFNSDNLIKSIKNRLMIIGLKLVIAHESQNNAQFTVSILKEFYLQFDHTYHQTIKRIERKILESDNFEMQSDGGTSIDEPGLELIKSRTPLTLAATKIIVSSSNNHKLELSKMLRHLIDIGGELPEGEYQKIILNYLFENGAEWSTDLISTYISKSTGDESKVKLTEELIELFWVCVSDYPNHKGRVDIFKDQFEKCVVFNIPSLAFNHLKDSKDKNVDKSQESRKSISLIEVSDDIYARISMSMKIDSNEILRNDSLMKWKELIYKGLTHSPSTLRKIIAEIDISAINIARLKASIGYDEFVSLIACDLHNDFSEVINGYKAFYQLLEKMGDSGIVEKSSNDFWSQTLEFIKTGKVNTSGLKKLVRKNLDLLAEDEEFNVHDVLMEIQNHGLSFPKFFIDILINENKAFSMISEHHPAKVEYSTLEKCHDREKVEDLLYELLLFNQIPSWFYQKEVKSVEILVNKIIRYYPLAVYKVLKYYSIPDARISTLCAFVPLSEMVIAIYSLHPQQQGKLVNLEKFHATLSHVDIKGIRPQELQNIIYKKILMAWTSSRWSTLNPSNILKELMWDVCVQFHVQKEDFLKGMESSQNIFPSPIKLGLSLLLSSEKENGKINTRIIKSESKKLEMTDDNLEMNKEEIFVKNAGIVLLSNYIPTLFNRLGLIEDNKFIDHQSQLNAVHFTQFLVTGQSDTDEMLLPLNKLLCGIQPSEPIMDGIEITEDQKNLLDGLLSAVIGHWPAIGDSSIMGFRGNWLVREGVLSEGEDRWELRVDKKPYDVLISKSPFSFSIIKFPWMNKPIHVTWPY